MGSKEAKLQQFKIRTGGRRRGGVACGEQLSSFFSCLSKSTGNANVTTVCASEIAALRACAASVARQPKTVNTSTCSDSVSVLRLSLALKYTITLTRAPRPPAVNYHLQRISKLMR